MSTKKRTNSRDMEEQPMAVANFTVLDVTRMGAGNVCVAGVSHSGVTIRPVFERGPIGEEWLFERGKMVVRPFAVIGIELGGTPTSVIPPHTEDRIIHRSYSLITEVLPSGARRDLLASTAVASMNVAFGAQLLQETGSPKWFLHPETGTRSLATIRVEVNRVIFRNNEYRPGTRTYELEFRDETGSRYLAAVTDLAFRAWLEDKYLKGVAPSEAGAEALKLLPENETWLRVGLSRGWDRGGSTEKRCYLQVNGVHTFPDYLQGRCYGEIGNKTSSRSNPRDFILDDVPF